jgi:hypothetical protein
MASIERKPLPPPNSTAVAITEADRADMTARANAVIDYYLNGPGSYWDAGTRKPLVSKDEGGESTLNDLKKFKDSVIASKQYADDPSSIMESIIDLIDRARGQIQETARSNKGIEGISRLPPNTDDPIDDPRVISPRFLNNAAEPISLEGDQPVLQPREGATSGIVGSEPTRFLSRKIVSRPPPTVFSPIVEEAPVRVRSTGVQGDAQSIRSLSRRVVPEGNDGNFSRPGIPSPFVPLSQSGRARGLVTGEPMPQWPVPPPIWDFPDRFGDDRESPDLNGSSTPTLDQYIRYLSRANGT